MNILEIIAKKRDGKILEKKDIEYFVNGYTKNIITDYHIAALIMAIYINGMNEEEISNLTMSMANSGEILDLSQFGTVVDKHSTGGVGDKVTLIVMPLIAALGVPVGKMSGRGLGFTGGTIDKLEAIPGYNTNLEKSEFLQNIRDIGISLTGQTLDLAPADRKLYALRDSINCTDSIPLIASSIMCKKIAAGANKIVLDVTCGSGAFMKQKKDAIKLANIMKQIGNLTKKETTCIITNMEEPLGKFVGNSLEVIEAIDSLNGNMEQDVKQVVLEIGAYLLKLAGKGNDINENKIKLCKTIENKKGIQKFIELVEKQGGDISYIKNTNKFEKAKYIYKVIAKQDGYVHSLNAEKIGKIASYLGAGRQKKTDNINPRVGVQLNKKVGAKVLRGENIACIYADDEEKGKKAVVELEKNYVIKPEKVEPYKVILDIL